MTTRKILVVVDPTINEQPAVERAAWLATKMSATLELFICEYDPDIDAGRTATVWISQPARENLLSITTDKLERIAAPLREQGLQVDTDVAWDHPLDQGIVRKVVTCKPWMVVKDTHHHNVLKRTILSNTDWHLIRDCPAPLLLVKPGAVADTLKVMAAVDPMHTHDKEAQLDNDILNKAIELVDATGGSLQVVHSYSNPPSVGVADAALLTEATVAVEAQHREVFTQFVASYAIADDRTHLLEGPAHVVLPEITAKEDSDLIVMGAVSRSGFDRVFVGSTAERVLDRLPCDLLIVKGRKASGEMAESERVTAG